MSNLHRLQWVDARIRAGCYPNARELAEQFEISRRQALRDFEYLRDSLGAPLEYAAVHRGYTYSHQAFALPGAYVTGPQQSMLGYLARYYGTVAQQDSRFAAAYAEMAELFQRLGGGAGGGAGTRAGGDPAAGVGARGPALPVTTPYRAILRTGPRPVGQPPAPLQPYWRGQTEPTEAACEFTDPTEFLQAYLSAWVPWPISWPTWLAERLRRHLQTLSESHADVTRHVTPPPLLCAQRPPDKGRSSFMVTTEARFTGMWNSWAGSVHGIVTANGLFDGDMTDLMGMTGMAFHLIMHEECCVSSVTVYDWISEHRAFLDRIGVLAEVYDAMPHETTYEAARRRAVPNIKAALDQGRGVVLWGVDTGEFGVVYGYNDNDGVFLVSGCFGHDGCSNPILYENLGKTFAGAPILDYQILVDRVAFDRAAAYRSSLEYYLRHMEAHAHVAPGYKTGLLGYDNWIRALESGKFQAQGLRYNTSVYAESKQHAAEYVKRLAASWNPKLEAAVPVFERVAGLYGRMLTALGGTCGGEALFTPVSAEQAAALVPLLKEARSLEAEAVALVRAALS